jgi:hypothetical protein
MITTERRLRSPGLWLTGCILMSSATFGATPVAAEDAAKTSGGASTLVEVMTRPGPPGRLSKGYFDNNPGCVSAKLDIWFARGRHTHQLFTLGIEQDHASSSPPGERTPSARPTGGGDGTNPAYRDVMDADGTTIFVGREGCRIRIRIDRAE